MNDLLEALSAGLKEKTFVRLVLSRPVSSTAEVRRTTVRMVLLKTGPVLQFAFSRGKQETHQNLSEAEALREIERLFATDFQEASLFTTAFDLSVKRLSGGRFQTQRRAASKPAEISLDHNRRKQYLIPEDRPCPFLVAIGVMTPEGRVRAAHYDKFRQINRFLEFVNDIYPSLPASGELRVIDFGCGRSYLTFALHHLLSSIHGRDVQITGLDLKQEVIADCNRIAGQLACRGLEFQAGDMAGFRNDGPVHLAVSLHACDTATDMALAQAVTWQADVILSVPCCHHEFAAQMSKDWLPPVQRHGILKERMAELLTDAYRCGMLESCGYRTQAIEFIELEHTPRNTLIRAARRSERQTEHEQQAGQQAEALRQAAGIRQSTLQQLLMRPDGDTSRGSE